MFYQIAFELYIGKGIKSVKDNELIESLQNELKPYHNKKFSSDANSVHYYNLPGDHDAIKTIQYLTSKYPKTVSAEVLFIQPIYTEEEADQFVAFIPAFYDHYCIEYDDVDAEYDECDLCGGRIRFRESLLWNEKSFGMKHLIKPEGYIKKAGSTNTVLCIDDDRSVMLVTPLLYQNLIKEGFTENSFRAVETKKGSVLAYELLPDCVLPCGAVTSDRFISNIRCKKCGAIYYDDELSFQYQPYYLDADYKSLLGTITATTDYYDENEGRPFLLVSPALRKAFLKYCPNAKFIPVQSSEQAR